MRFLPFRVVLLCAGAIFILTTIICYNSLHDDAIRSVVLIAFINRTFFSRSKPPSAANKPEHLLCILIPFRNCEHELSIMVPALHLFLQNQDVAHKFLVLNQTDSFRFNRAALINAGFVTRLGFWLNQQFRDFVVPVLARRAGFI